MVYNEIGKILIKILLISHASILLKIDIRYNYYRKIDIEVLLLL